MIKEFSDHDLILPLNVRNTEQVIEETKELTGRDIGKKGTGKGPKTEWIRYETAQERDREVKKKIDGLVASQLDSGEIVVVGVKDEPQEGSLAQGLADLGIRITSFKAGDLANYPFTTAGYATPSQIKGIEAYCIIIDLGEFGLERLSEPMFYVAITRAKGRLVLALPRSISRELSEIMNKNVPLE